MLRIERSILRFYRYPVNKLSIICPCILQEGWTR